MELTGTHLLPAPRDRVWSALLDPDTLRAAIPGCESVTTDGDGVYRVVVVAAVGPVRARFQGRVRQHDLQPPQRCTLAFEGDGGVAGVARGSAEVDLDEPADAAGHTRLVYRAQAQVGGRLAQIGSRLVDATAARMSAQFFERFVRVITTPPADATTIADGSAAATGTATAGPDATAAGAALPAAAGAAARPAATPVATDGRVTVQMPAWAWVATVAAFVLLVAWLAAR